MPEPVCALNTEQGASPVQWSGRRAFPSSELVSETFGVLSKYRKTGSGVEPSCGMSDSRSDGAGCEPAVSGTDAHGGAARGQSAVVERLSRHGGMHVTAPAASQRRSRLQRQQEVAEGSAPGAPQRGAPERGSLTPAMRKKHLKELLLSLPSRGGLSGGPSLSSQTDADAAASSERDAAWALYPVEHAWMLNAVEGSYESIVEFVSADPYLLTRRDFISGYSVLHWLAKRGQDETLLKLLRYAERAGIPVNVNVRGSGGLTPLHVASMHRQYSVIKLLVGAFSADVDAMDYNGRRAWQYVGGDAPLEMRELLGTWDEEHSGGGGGERNANKNANNSAREEVDGDDDDGDDDDGGGGGGGGETEDVGFFDRAKREGSWRFGSIRKLLSSFSFVGNKR